MRASDPSRKAKRADQHEPPDSSRKAGKRIQARTAALVISQLNTLALRSGRVLLLQVISPSDDRRFRNSPAKSHQDSRGREHAF